MSLFLMVCRAAALLPVRVIFGYFSVPDYSKCKYFFHAASQKLWGFLAAQQRIAGNSP
ncbi:MAG: hypothetical protein IAE87_10270 [Rhodobacteraceae bacterium]|nr:hypothetical protein [Paracoccaceae bacterium]